MMSLTIWTGCSSDSETAKPVVLTGIQIDAANVKKTYFASDILDLSGLVVTANYSNGTSKVLSKEEYEVTPVNGSSFTDDGELTVTVTFNGMSDSFKVNVIAVQLESIELDTTNVKKTYFASEKLDLDGLLVTANYSDGTSRNLENEEYEVTPVNGSSFTNDGEFTVTVTFNGMSDSFKVNVIAVQLESIELDTTNVKKTYFVSEELNLDGLLVTSVSNNGTRKVLSKEEYSVSPSADTIFQTSGEVTVKVIFDGKSNSFKVNVLNNYLTSVQITFPDEYQDKTDLLTYSEESKSFTAAEGYKSYAWWLDGEILSATTGTNYTPENLEIGNHTLMLVVTDSVDETYSTTATFKVQK